MKTEKAKKVKLLRTLTFATAFALMGMGCLCFPAEADGQENGGGWISVYRPSDRDLTEGLRLDEEVGTSYYVSSSQGSDDNDGLSEDSPWRTFAHVNERVLEPGDRVLLRRGDTWGERLVIRGKGREDAWIFVGAWGDPGAAPPEIALGNRRDDVAVLVSDITSPHAGDCGFAYIWLDNLHISHTCLGIYVRAAVSERNTGVRITNCRFTDINCPELMEEALTSTAWLAEEKGQLPTLRDGQVFPTGGGAYEYIWPTAINFGGRPAVPMSAIEVPGRAEPTVRVTGIEMYQNEFDGCVVAVGANTYAIHYGTGPDQCFTYTTNWRVRGLTARNTMTLFNIDSADMGYDGTPGSQWGIWENCLALSGMEKYSMSAGTTQALFSCCRNLYIRNSQFNDCRNNGYPDGCGFDFERSVFNFTLENCVFAGNQGQGVLMMQTTMENQVTGEQVTTENGSCTLKNCLFYDNFRQVYNSNYKFSFLMFNKQNTDILLDGCFFYERVMTAGKAQVTINRGGARRLTPVGPETAGVTVTDTCVLTAEKELPRLEKLMDSLGLSDAAVSYPAVDRVWIEYTREPTPDSDVQTEPRTETGSATEPPVSDTAGPASPSPAPGGCASVAGSGIMLLPAVAGAVTVSCIRKRKAGNRQ